MLSDAQRSSLAARLRQGREHAVEVIPRREREVSELPLSFGQEQLWFVDQFAPGLSVYNLAGTVHLPVDDLTAGDQATRETHLRDLAGREASAPFDLAVGPLLRVRLVRLAADEHVLLTCMHHAVFDGWSFGIFQRELATF